MRENSAQHGFRHSGNARRASFPLAAALAVIAVLVPACKDGGGAGGGSDGGGGASGSGGAGGQTPVDASGDGSDGATIADGPLAFDLEGALEGVRLQAATAAAQVITSGTQQAPQHTLRVRGMGGAFSLDINLVGSTAFAPGTYSCNPATATGSALVYSETSPAKAFTSFEAGCSVTLTAVGAVNERVVGTFQGMVRSGAEAPRSITNGVFDVVRAL